MPSLGFGLGVARARRPLSAPAPIVDTEPDAFGFSDIANAERSTVYESNEITVTGINAPSPISVSGGQYSKNGGAYTAVAGTVIAGDAVKVRGTSSGSYSTASDVVLTVGGISDIFTITTKAAPAAAPRADSTTVRADSNTIRADAA